ncbi:chromosome segregation protein SMC, partial [Candidatus Bathyarchaeota archaeon]|nr:chromosome segregation protein SMC [Candidatus Bathyarchaeota archaeon]
IPGVHGRLKNLVKIDKGYERAIEAAASGWLDALVVEDLHAAFTCVETLKKMKLGRIKIIPLNSLSSVNSINVPKVNGILGKASSFVKCEKRYERAVDFVFGDTLLALTDDDALTASKDGFRVVTVDGDLYEAGGGVESGYYRSSIDLSSFIPDEKVLKTLKRAVKVLRNHLERRETIISGMENDIAETQEEIAKLSEFLGKIESEVERVKKSVVQVESNIKQAEKNIAELSSRIEKENERLRFLEKRLEELSKMEGPKKNELTRLKDEINLLKTHEAETRRESLANELIALRQKYNRLESRISTLRSKIENVLKVNLENLESQIEEISKQSSALEEDVKRLLKERQEIKRKIENMEKAKENLSKSLLSDKMEVEKFTSQIDALDKELIKSEKSYEENMRVLNDLKLKMQTMKIRLSQYREQLKTLGYEKPIAVTQSMLENINSRLEAMRMELTRIGAVNQLADAQYIEQVSRYKKISVRLNELEKEKMAILKFIEEIEQKKYRVFMDAFNKINERLNFFFSKLTGGGRASLKLENPENPFAGGVDMLVQFPNKTPILVSGASSGERSVSAVAFLFALQEFSPASFYLFDEMDAHLDAFHVEMLGELLAEEASNSQLQFIVITLKPEMISKADKIYGVYAQSGVSHVISTTFKGAQ